MFFRRHGDGTTSRVEDLREELVSVTGPACSGDCDAARRARQLRHLLGLALLEEQVDDVSYVEPVEVSVGPEGLPEVSHDELTAAAVRGGILDRGCLLVRGLIPDEEATRIVHEVDRAIAVRDAIERGEPGECGYFEHFEPDPRYRLYERSWIHAGGIWTADSPFLTAHIYSLFEDRGLTPLAREYLQEEPLLSVQKGTLRKVSRQNKGAWHQDGHFLGSVRALNIWISLSRCGDVAPGMSLVPRRLDEIVETGTEGAPLHWTVADDVVKDVAGDRGLVRPIFNPGDALMFDDMFLHTTAVDDNMPETRYAIETWFFGASAFPPEYAPIAL